MTPLTRSVVRQLPIVSKYRDCLTGDNRALKPLTVVAYISNVSSFVIELSKEMNEQCVAIQKEREALSLAASRNWRLLKRDRKSTLTARLLTVSRGEVCDVLSWLSGRKNVHSMASFCSAVGGFYRWLESSDLLEENHFEEVRSRIQFRWRIMRDSIENCR